MKKIKCLMVVLVAAVAIFAGTAVQAADKEQLTKDLFEAMHLKESTVQIMEIARQQMSAQMPQVMKQMIGDQKSELTDEEYEYLTEEMMPKYMDRMMEAIFDAIDVDMLIDDVYVPLYVKYFDEEDLVAMKVFYESPAGQKMVDVTPKLTGEAMQLFMMKSSSLMVEAAKKVEAEMMEELMSRFDDD